MNRCQMRPHRVPKAPISLHPPIGPRDVQQDPPAFWCLGCGKEIYKTDTVLCDRCKKEESYETLTN